MLSPQSSLEGLKRQAGSTLAEVQPWIERLARFGYVGKGVVYGLIGVLAFLAAIGPNGEATDRQGAISAIAAQPYGAPLLYALGVGLLGYALWRFLMAAYNPERRSGFKRVVYVVTGLVYGGLGVLAFDGAMGGKPKSDEVGWTAELMSQPFGRLLVMGLGVVVIAVGVAQFVNAAKCLFCDVLMRYRMNEAELRWAKITGRIGLTARGIVFLLMGGFFLRAGYRFDPRESGGLDDALLTLANAPLGPWLLGIVALGLMCYAVFMFVEARYRRMTPPVPDES